MSKPPAREAALALDMSHSAALVCVHFGGVSVQAIAAYEECSRLCPENTNASQNRLLALNYIHPGESRLVCVEHAAWGRDAAARVEPLPEIGRAHV